MVLCRESHNVQAEADNLDCVTKSALLAQENQHLKERLETQTQQMLHVQEEVCGLRGPTLLQPCPVPVLTLQCSIVSIAKSVCRLQIAVRLVRALLCHVRYAHSKSCQ